MQGAHPFYTESDDWEEFDEFLSGSEKMAVLAFDEGEIQNGSRIPVSSQDLYLGPAEAFKGRYLVIPPENAASIWESGAVSSDKAHLGSQHRNDAEFYFGNLDGSPVEIKYDPDMPDSEDWHSHTSFEAYSPIDGEVTLGLISDIENLDFVEERVEEGEVFVVPPYVQHKVVDKNGDPDLAVLRYGSDDENISKFDIEGNSLYSWAEPSEFRFEPYDPEEAFRPENV